MRVIGFILFVIIGLLIFTNCTSSLKSKPDPPADLIHRDTMVSVVAELRLMDAIIVNQQRKGERGKSDFKYLLDKTIMNKFNITHDQFDRSFMYYQNELKILDEIYADAITKLTLMKSELNKE